MKLPWLEGHRGNSKYLPCSHGKGIDLVQKELLRLNAQIAVLFGRPGGTMENLREGVEKLMERSSIVCQCCERSILKDGHRDDCPILLGYIEMENKEPKNPYNKKKNSDD
jgi:hypothetical protein